MTDHDRLRRALSDLAGSPPPAGDRLAAVARNVVVRRRVRAGGASTLLAVALLAGAVAGGAVQPPRAVSFLQITGDNDDDSQSHASPDRTQSPHATARPSHSTAASARSASAHASPRPSPRPSDRPSGRPSRSPSPNAGAGTTSPLEVRVGLRPAEATEGERVVVRIGVRDGDGALLGVRVTFGDGHETSRRVDPQCGSARPHPTSRTIEVPHVYEAAGVYVVAVTVRTGECGAAPERREQRARLRVFPRDGDRPSNGGALPTARAEQVRPQEETAGAADYVAVRVGGADSDGYVTRMVLDWGDGTEPSVLTFPLSECREMDSGFPASRRSTTLRHVYAHDGRYEARLLVVSTGCDGHTEQSGRTTTRVLDPMPSPSPRPSPSPSPSATRAT